MSPVSAQISLGVRTRLSRASRTHGANGRYLLARVAQGVIVVVGALVISFGLTQITGNPAEVLAGGAMSDEQVQLLSKQLGYERPVVEQFTDYFSSAAVGDFGTSFRFGEPALTTVLQALPKTLLLVAGAIVVASAVAVPTAVFSVLRRESRTDRALRSFVIVGQGIPEFWLGLLLTLVFAVWLGWLPSLYEPGVLAYILPTVTLAVPLAAMLIRLLRADLLDIMTRDFIVALRGKGIAEREIVTRHALRNAVIPFITFLALQVGWLIGGTIIVEAVFVWPGIGTLALSAVETRDLPVVQAIVVVVATAYVLLNLAVDLLVMWVDPRIRLGQGAM